MTEQELSKFYTTIGQRIAEARKRQSLKQEPFAEKFDLSRSSIVNIEKGRQKPSLHLLWEISKKLNINITDLLPARDSLSSQDKTRQVREQIDGKIDKKSQKQILSLISEATLKS